MKCHHHHCHHHHCHRHHSNRRHKHHQHLHYIDLQVRGHPLVLLCQGQQELPLKQDDDQQKLKLKTVFLKTCHKLFNQAKAKYKLNMLKKLSIKSFISYSWIIFQMKISLATQVWNTRNIVGLLHFVHPDWHEDRCVSVLLYFSVRPSDQKLSVTNTC